MFLALAWRGDCTDRQTVMGGGGGVGRGGAAEAEELLAELTVANTSKVCQLAL